MQDTETRVFGVTAGLGSGKTHGIAQVHHYLVRQNVGAMFSGWLMPTYQKIHDAGIPTYKKVLAQFGLVEDRDYKVLKSPFPKLVYLDQPHEVHFLTAENPANIVAVEFSHGTEDEAGAIVQEASNNFRSRIRADCKRRVTIRAGAPQGINDFAADFDSHTLEGWTKEHSRVHTNAKRKFKRFILHTGDNKYLPPGYVDELIDTYGHNQQLLKAYIYGLFCDLQEGTVFSNYRPDVHDIDDIEPDPLRPIELSFDFNNRPMAWVSLQKVVFLIGAQRREHMVAYHEANTDTGNLDDSVCEFAAKHPVGIFKDTPIVIDGDRSGHSGSHRSRQSDYERIAEILRELGYNFVTIKAGRAVVLETDSIEAVNKMFHHNYLLINKRCKMLKRSLAATKYKEGVRKIDKPAGETHTHHADALKYWAYRHLKDVGLGRLKIYGMN